MKITANDNGTFNLEVDEKFMSARLSITPAVNGGKEVSEKEIREALALNGIRYNIDSLEAGKTATATYSRV